MRTNIVIDDELMRAVLKATGLRTKREAVEAGPGCSFSSSNRKASGSTVANWPGSVTFMP